MKISTKRHSGFTLIELLIVVTVIAILSILVIANLSSARAKARDAQITSNLHEVNLGLSLYISNGDTTPVIPSTIASVGFNDLINALKPKYLPASMTLVHPLSAATPPRNYEFKQVTTGGTMNYALCAQLENPTTGNNWYIIENGSSHMGSSDAACN